MTMVWPACRFTFASQATMLDSGSNSVSSSAEMSSESPTNCVPGRIDMYSP